MKATVEQLNPVQYRVNIEVAPEEVNQAFDSVFRRLQKKARVQGFRPGKAPIGVIRKLYGAHVAGEVHEDLIKKHLFTALDEQTIRPIASPMVESGKAPLENQGFNFSAVVDVMPKLEITDYKGLSVQADRYDIKEETVERELNQLRRRQAKTKPVEAGAAAAKGMLAAISHTAQENGVDIPSMSVRYMTVFLGENELFQGLEEAILGMQSGAEKTAAIQLPKTYGDQALAGKELSFHITLHDLKHVDLPALDDEFAKDLELESLEALKTDIKKHLEARAGEIGRQKLETALLDRIIDQHPFEVPPAMVDQVIDGMIQELPHKTEADRSTAMQDQDLRQSLLPAAKRRTQNTLLLWHITQQEKLQVSDDELQSRLNRTLGASGISDPKQISKLRKNLEPRIRESMMFEKAMNFLIDNANITEIPAEL